MNTQDNATHPKMQVHTLDNLHISTLYRPAPHNLMINTSQHDHQIRMTIKKLYLLVTKPHIIMCFKITQVTQPNIHKSII